MTVPSPLYNADRLARARDLARALTRSLTCDLILARDLTRALDRILAHGLVQARVRALISARTRPALVDDLFNTLERDHLLHPLDRDHDQAHTCDLARALTRELAHAHNLDLDFVLVLRDALYRINAFIDRWERLDASTPRVAKPEPASIVPWAERLVGFMMGLLPARYRDRYTEEFRAELYDLAQVQATGTAQVVYTLQQLGRVWHLREALLTPDRPRFHRLRRAAYWVLTSNWRTWGLLGPLLTFGVVNIHLSQGWGSALFTLPGIVGFYAGVEWLRKRWDMEVKRADKTAGDLSNE